MTTVSVGRKQRRMKGTNTFVAHLVMAFFGILMAFPFVWQLIMSLSTNEQVTGVPPTLWPGVLQWSNYADALTRIPFLQQMWVTIQVTLLTNLAHVVFCTMAGYAFARMNFPFKRTLFALVLAVLMIPGQVFILPVYQIIQGLNLLNTVSGIVLPGLISAFGIFLMRQFFSNIPNELEEAARLDGASSFQIFWRVMLPLTAPGISALVVLGVLDSWNDLMWPLIVATKPEIYTVGQVVGLFNSPLSHQTVDMVMTANLLAAIPPLLFFLIFQRKIVEGIAMSGSKG